MGFFDNHNHSQFSFDGKKTTVEESAAAAFAKGLDGICFTDHCDFYVPPMKAQFEHLVPEVFDVESQQAEIDRVNAASYAALPGNRRFRELGGEAVSLGSDSHDAQRTGDNFRRVQVSCPFRVQTAPHDSAVMLTGTAGRPAAERAQGMSGYKKRGLQSSFFVSLSGPPLFRGIARSGVSSLIRCIRAFDIFRDTVHTDID